MWRFQCDWENRKQLDNRIVISTGAERSGEICGFFFSRSNQLQSP
jgi:hypothetical protein